jgi:hypothetical protein
MGSESLAFVAALASGVEPKSGLDSLIPIVNWERILLDGVLKEVRCS